MIALSILFRIIVNIGNIVLQLFRRSTLAEVISNYLPCLTLDSNKGAIVQIRNKNEIS